MDDGIVGDVIMDDLSLYAQNTAWLSILPETICKVRVKYKPEYYGGKEETLKWVPLSCAALFWREEKDKITSGVWWSWLESFSILDV